MLDLINLGVVQNNMHHTRQYITNMYSDRYEYGFSEFDECVSLQLKKNLKNALIKYQKLTKHKNIIVLNFLKSSSRFNFLPVDCLILVNEYI